MLGGTMNQNTAIAGLEVLNALHKNTQAALRAALIENKKLKTALEFYADTDNLREIQLMDQGRKAREVLGG